MDTFDIAYNAALDTLEASISNSLVSLELPTEADIQTILKSDSSLDAWDYCYAIAIGLAGVFIGTNEAFGKYLDDIHKAASGSSGDYDKFQSFLGNLLHHEGDHIDMIERPFKDRNGGNAYCIFHRLLWGHDIFSIQGDNPFVLMFKQKGLGGILQAVRHLLADTASKQGLPLPGSSFFDTVTEDNKTSNYLIKVAQQLSKESTGLQSNAQDIYSHIFTIRAQDVTAGAVVKLVSELYFKLRKIDDNIRRSEIRLIAYSVNFFGEAVVGCIKQKGVPYINIPLAGAMATSFAQFCYYNDKEVRKLTANTKAIHSQVERIEIEIATSHLALPQLETADDFLEASNQADENVSELLNFFGEESI